MMRRALPFLVLVSSCGNPRLEIAVELPASLKPLIHEVRLHLYQPPPGAPFRCADLELGKVDANTLRLAESQTTTLLQTTASAPLRDLDRLTAKVVYVEARGDEDRPIAFACSELAEFSDDVAVELAAEPAARMQVPAAISLSRSAGDPVQPRVPLAVVDALDQPIPDALIEWVVAGIDGISMPAQRRADGSGAVDLDPDLPARPGPFVVEARARWGTEAPLSIEGLVAPVPKKAELQGLALGAAVGRIGPSGEAVAAVFLRAGGWMVDIYDATSFTAARELVPVAQVSVDGGSTLGILDYPGDEQDRLVVLSTSGNNVSFTRVEGAGQKITKTTAKPSGAGNNIKKVLSGGSCDASGAPEMTVVFDGDILARYDANGNLLGSNHAASGTADYLASGCVSDETGALRRVFVRTAPLGGVIVEIAGAGGPGSPGYPAASIPWLSIGTGLAFSPSIGGESTLIGSQLILDDFVITRAKLILNESPPRLQAEGTDGPPGIPVSTAGADLDGDQRLDIVSLLSSSASEGQPRTYALWASTAEELNGKRIAGALTLTDTNPCGLAMIAGDFDNDGKSDVIIAEGSRLLCGSTEASRAWFYPMGTAP